MFHGLALAREIRATGAIPLADSFAFTPTRSPVVHHEWLTGLLLDWVLRRTGTAGFVALRFLLVAAVVISLGSLAWWEGARAPVLGCLGLLGLNMLAPGMTAIRAQVFTTLFTVAVLWMLALDRRGQRWWIGAYLPLHLVWLNMHGGVVVGPALLLAHAIEQAVRRRPFRHLIAVAGLAGLMLGLSPYGWAYPRYLWSAVRLDRSLITEWQPLWHAPGAMRAWGAALLVVAYGVLRLGPGEIPGVVLVLASAAAALGAQRHLPLFAVVWIAQMAPAVQRTPFAGVVERLVRDHRYARTIAMGLLGATSLTAVIVRRPWVVSMPVRPAEGVSVVYPEGAVAYLQESGFHGNLFTPFVVGAYVSWRAYPDVKVSIDGRFEAAYDPALLVEHEAVYRCRGDFARVLARYRPDALLVPSGWCGGGRLPSWTVAYRDDAYEIYVPAALAAGLVDRRGAALPMRFP